MCKCHFLNVTREQCTMSFGKTTLTHLILNGMQYCFFFFLYKINIRLWRLKTMIDKKAQNQGGGIWDRTWPLVTYWVESIEWITKGTVHRVLQYWLFHTFYKKINISLQGLKFWSIFNMIIYAEIQSVCTPMCTVINHQYFAELFCFARPRKDQIYLLDILQTSSQVSKHYFQTKSNHILLKQLQYRPNLSM